MKLNLVLVVFFVCAWSHLGISSDSLPRIERPHYDQLIAKRSDKKQSRKEKNRQRSLASEEETESDDDENLSRHEKKRREKDKNRIPKGQYFAGGIVGSIVGLGIGHGIQGRYFGKGLLFTITEAAGLGLAIYGGRSISNSKTGEEVVNNVGMYLAGIGIFAGFKIFEIVNVWIGAKPERSSSAYNTNPTAPRFFPVVASTGSKNYLGLGVSF